MPKYLLLADSHLSEVTFLLSTVTSDVTYVLFDPTTDTFESLIQKIPSDLYSRVGILQDNVFTESYHFLKSQESSLLKNVSLDDPTLQTWSSFIQLLQKLKDFGMSQLDFIECNLGTPDWLFVTQQLSQNLNIQINYSTNVIGQNGTWILDNDPTNASDDVLLVGLYFTNNVQYYPYNLGTSGGTVTYDNYTGAMHIINTNHEVYSWGKNWFGCFGIGNTLINQQVWQYTLTPPSSFPSNPIAIDGGTMFTIICLENGTVYGCGLNVGGETGTLTGYAWGPNQSLWYSPVIVPGITTAVDVACGDAHTLVLLSNGDVMAFGNNQFGQLAINSTLPESVAYNNYTSAVVKCDIPEKIKNVYANLRSSLFLTANGTLYVSGDNYNGIIGLGSTSTTISAVKITTTLFKTLSVGFFFTLGIDLNGNIWGTGRNETFQLGTGDTTGYDTFHQITTSTVYKTISAGFMHAGAIDDSNRLWMWGNNLYGPLGNGTNIDVSVPTLSNQTNVNSIIMTGYRYTIIGLYYGTNIIMYSTGLNTASRLRNVYDDAYQSWGFSIMNGSSSLYVLPPPEPVFTYLNNVVINDISPFYGTKNTSVIVSGNYLNMVTKAYYDVTHEAVIVHNSPTSITLTTPVGSGIVSISFLDSNGKTIISPSNFTYTNPSVTSVLPSSGLSGSILSITGFNLSNTSFVTIGTNATFTTSSSGLSVTVPVGTGSPSIVITDTLGNTLNAGVFTYTQPPDSVLRSTICFPSGTFVKTDQGQVEIQKLDVELHTLQSKKIIKVIETYCMDQELVLLKKDALRKNYPNEDTLISKRHKIYYRGKMKASQKFVGKREGVTFVPYKGEKLYNILLEEYGKMNVNGMVCETLHPDNPISKLFNPTNQLNPII